VKDALLWVLAASTLRLAAPLIFTALGGLLSERSGVIAIGLEGFMLVGAFAAAAGAHASQSPWIGALAAVGAGALMGLIYAVFAVYARANQIVAGTAMNLFAAGLTPFFCKILYDVTGSTPALDASQRLESAPFVGAWVALLLVHVLYTRLEAGLKIRFAGEHPESLDASGASVRAWRVGAVTLSGVLAALGGATLSICLSSSFSRGMTAGRGFMALAAVIFGKWKPIPTVLACLLFGFFDAVQMRLQGASVGSIPVPVQFIQILPYVATVAVLAGFVGGARPPRALGLPFRKG